MKKIQDAEKEAGGDEKLIFKFAWPYIVHACIIIVAAKLRHACTLLDCRMLLASCLALEEG